MKRKNIKIFALVVILLVLSLSLFAYNNYFGSTVKSKELNKIKETQSTPLNDIDKDAETTDIFDAYLVRDINEDNKEPGHRFIVDIVNPQKRLQKGNAQGSVVVNDLISRFNSLSNTQKNKVLYRFYTKYDIKNNWYTLIKAEFKYSSMMGGGDQ